MGRVVELFGGGTAKPVTETAAAPDAAERGTGAASAMAPMLEPYSIEVMPRTAAKIDDFRAILPAETRIYIAQVGDTPLAEMRATAARLTAEGFAVMPHAPARAFESREALDEQLAAYAALGVDQALVLAGGLSAPRGPFADSRALLETGLFEAHGFKRLHVAGHPEGNRDIDADGGARIADAALLWKQDFAAARGVALAVATQFAFDAAPVVAWAERLRGLGLEAPIHVGVAGPAKLQTLIKFAIACGVGPSLRVLQRRAADMTKLLLPFEPTDVLTDLARHKTETPETLIAQAHLFPLGGIARATQFANAALDRAGAAAQTA